MSWAKFAQQEPKMAELGKRILTKYGIAYLGTVRKDGGPRVHPICPVIINDAAYIGIIPSSPKRYDLDRDNRFVLHALPGPNDAEFWLAGTVRRLSREEVLEVKSAAGSAVSISLSSAMYELKVERVNCTTYTTDQGPMPVPARARWQADGVS